MVERSVHEDALAAHTAEVDATKITYDNIIGALYEDIGTLQADNTLLSGDVAWFQEDYRQNQEDAEQAPNEQAPAQDEPCKEISQPSGISCGAHPPGSGLAAPRLTPVSL